MAVVTNSIFIDILLAIIPITYLVYWYLTNNNDYWDKRGVPCTKNDFLVPTILGRKSQGELSEEMYQTYSGQRFCGFFQLKQPMLLVRDPELINKILVKDFTHFTDRFQIKTKPDVLDSNLFNLTGQVWRALRYKLTPTFTTGKLKGMHEQVSNCGDNMIERMEDISGKNIEPKEYLYEFTLDVILSCAFGLQFKYNSSEFSKFRSAVKSMFNFTTIMFLKVVIMILFPKLADMLELKQFPHESSQYFVNLTKSTIKYRKDNNIKRNDYLQLLMILKEQEESGKDMGLSTSDNNEEDIVVNQMQYAESSSEPPSNSNIKLFTDDVICANSAVFLVAGSETISNTVSFTLFELSRNPDIQQKLQQEVDSALVKHGKWTYGAVKDMTYLDQVIQESQRLYPVLPILQRECVERYKVPESDLVIEKGVNVFIPSQALHKDPQYYPDPDHFKPERFEGNHFKPSSVYMPFGDGPRICIGMRFAIMEMKTCLAKIMSQYTVKLSSKTQVPLQPDPRSVFLSAKGGIWLSFEKRNTK